MKKIFLSALLASFTLVSCKKEENKIEQPMTDPPVENVNEGVTNTAEDINANAQTFQYTEADQFAKEYVQFINEYKVAISNNDSEALKELGPKLNNYQQRAVELAKRVPQDEAVKFQDFINGLERYIK
jgi:hypothetical protein